MSSKYVALRNLAQKLVDADEAIRLFHQNRDDARVESARGEKALRSAEEFIEKYGRKAESALYNVSYEAGEALKDWLYRNPFTP